MRKHNQNLFKIFFACFTIFCVLACLYHFLARVTSVMIWSLDLIWCQNYAGISHWTTTLTYSCRGNRIPVEIFFHSLFHSPSQLGGQTEHCALLAETTRLFLYPLKILLRFLEKKVLGLMNEILKHFALVAIWRNNGASITGRIRGGFNRRHPSRQERKSWKKKV